MTARHIATLAFLSFAASATLHAQDFTATVKSILEQTNAAKPLAVPGTAPGWFLSLIHI